MPRPNRPRPIPPDPEGYNDRWASWAEDALNEFQSVTNCDREDVVADLLCNLRHWCDRHGMSFSRENERAGRNYRDEITPLTAQDLGANPTPEGPNDVPF